MKRNTKTLSLLLSLDTEKAFDRIHWGFLRSVLIKFGFEREIIAAIMALCKGLSAKVYTNGMISKTFCITNGTQQGSPLSSLILVLIMEPLAQLIRTAPDVEGIRIGTTEHKKSLPAMQQLPHSFANVSYYKLNEDKSYILNVTTKHSQKTSLSKLFAYTRATHTIKYLGINIPTITSSLYQCNIAWFRKMATELLDLTKCELSLSGRINAFKIIVLPKLLYLFLTVPKYFFTKLQTLLTSYLWQHKKPRCPLHILTRTRVQG